jgi:hypothetical protein
MTLVPRKGTFEQLTRREYALIACGLGASILALLPVLLHHLGTSWKPGVPDRRERSTRRIGGPGRKSETLESAESSSRG